VARHTLSDIPSNVSIERKEPFELTIKNMEYFLCDCPNCQGYHKFINTHKFRFYSLEETCIEAAKEKCMEEGWVEFHNEFDKLLMQGKVIVRKIGQDELLREAGQKDLFGENSNEKDE